MLSCEAFQFVMSSATDLFPAVPSTHTTDTMSGKFEPKTPVTLQPPKETPITLEELSAANGESRACLSALRFLSLLIRFQVPTVESAMSPSR